MRISTFVFFCAVVSLSVGCRIRPPEGELGREYNEERKARQVPIIPDDWNGRGGYLEADWANPAKANPKTTENPMHAMKYLSVDPRRNLHQEYDYYYSGKKFPSKSEPDSFVSECLTVRYDYNAARAGKNPWRCDVSCGPHYRDTFRADERSGEVTFEEAEAILKEWGISRLNY